MQGGIFMLLSRDIGYLDNYYNGMKLKNVGVVKLQRVEDHFGIELSFVVEDCNADKAPVLLISENTEYQIGEVYINIGRGSFGRIGLDANSMGENREDYDAFYEVRIPLDYNRYLAAEYREKPKRMPLVEIAPQSIEVAQEEVIEEVVKENVDEEAVPVDNMGEEIQAQEIEERDGMVEDTQKKVEETFPETKWELLYQKLPKRIPFQDERRFLEMGPEDLAYLSERNFAYSKNPFLLYAYKQYGHVILGRVGQGKYHGYKLGVPGIYHTKEVQAALSYGFDSFESIDKKEPELKEGRQGYYFTTVSL